MKTKIAEKNISIDLPDYRIMVGSYWNELNEIISGYQKVFILVDENTLKFCWRYLKQEFNFSEDQLIQIQSGEINKTLSTCQEVWDQLFQKNADRKSLFINLGGGVIGDLGGFCASTYMRGIDFIQIPTTLLAQVDSSIGGKVGIDYSDLKNSVGLFINPKAVFIFPGFLQTLPQIQILSGFAELLKHALIADSKLYEILLNEIHEVNSDVNWSRFLETSLKIKRDVVLNDFREMGIRKYLNFGHTIGHAIESVLLNSSNSLLHGEAVAIGMVAESYISHKASGLSGSALDSLTSYIKTVFGKHSIDTDLLPDILELMKKDKKNYNDRIRFTLLEDIGRPVINQVVDQQLIEESIRYYNKI